MCHPGLARPGGLPALTAPAGSPAWWQAEGKEYFNPFAIREVRYALNFLINRQYIVDEILAGTGGPMLTVCPDVLPGSYKYNLVASKLGLKEEGDEQKGVDDITKALQAAAALPVLQGRLQKGEQWWLFDGEPVSVKFLIRVDDPQGRLKEGEYVSQQIEKAGIKVERLLYDRSKCGKLYRGSNPADYKWSLYTGGWRSGAASGFFETRIAQMYAPWYGNMPGQNKPEYWNYKHEEIDQLTEKAYSGNYFKDQWVAVGAGRNSMSKVTYKYLYGNLHHGRPMSIADLLYARAFVEEWRNKDGEDDPYYNAAYDSKLSPSSKTIKGWVLNKDGTITVYFDYNFPPSQEKVAAWAAPTTRVSRRSAACSWEIIEAIAKMVAEGSASGTQYSFTRGETTDVDILRPSCVQDIKAKLVEMKEQGYVPASIKDYLSREEAQASYTAAIDWIEKHEHAYISNGPYYLDKFDATSNYLELTAFRDPTYPYKSDYWPRYFTSTTARIDSLDIPSTFARDSREKGLPVKVYVSEESYPESKSAPTDKAKVSAILVTDAGEYQYDCKWVKEGYYETSIPTAKIKELPPGAYTILANAQMEGIEGSIPATVAATTSIF